MHFDRTHADVELVGDHLVGVAGKQRDEHLTLAVGQPLEARARHAAALALPDIAREHCEGSRQDFEQRLFLERLLDEVDRAESHRAHCGDDVAVTRHHHDRQRTRGG